MQLGGENHIFLTIKVFLQGILGFKNHVFGLSRDIILRKKIEEQLKKSAEQNQILLSEIHHRLKNNLAVISAMMELQSLDTENEEVRAMMADSQNRIKTMALIHEKLYESESLSEIEFGTYVKELLDHIRHISSVSGDIKLDLEYDTFLNKMSL